MEVMANTIAVKSQCRIITLEHQTHSTDETFFYGEFKSSLTFSGQISIDPEAPLCT